MDRVEALKQFGRYNGPRRRAVYRADDEVKTTLRPGRSALFLVVRQSDADATIAALRPFSGDVIQTTLDTETEEALRRALI